MIVSRFTDMAGASVAEVHARRQQVRNDAMAPFIVCNARSLVALPFWLKERTPNAYSEGTHSRRGDPVINVGCASNPNKPHEYDWCGGVIVVKFELYTKTVSIIKDYTQTQMELFNEQ